MKKWITEKKYNKIFDQLSYDLCEKTEADGTKIYTPDNFNKWMDRVIDMPGYTHSKWTVDTDKKEALDAAKEDLESITAEDFLKTF